MSLDRPLWLLALPAVLAFVWVVRSWGLSAVPPRQRTWALLVRALVVTLMALALAGLRVSGGGDRVAVVFLVDRSASVGVGGADRARGYIGEALEAKRRGDLAGVVLFGREPRLEFGLTDDPELGRLAADPDASATDLSRALRLGAGLFPPGTKRRVVVLTDGRETRGDARAEAERLAREGIAIDGVLLDVPVGADTSVERIDAPARVARGATYPVGVVVRSDGGVAHLEVTRDGRTILRRDLRLRPGRRTIVVDERASAPGVRRYEARLTATPNSVPENDHGAAAVLVEGAPRVLLLEGEAADGAALARALRAGGVQVERAAPELLPRFAHLVQYQSVVLADVPATRLRPRQVRDLRAAVTEAGVGLLTVGGDQAYGLGAYSDSELEQILPVDSEVKDPKRAPSVAEALVIDQSGSMAETSGTPGTTKADVARTGAARAIASLKKKDIVGVLAFNTESTWLLPLQKAPSHETVREALGGMRPDGGTDIGQAIDAAWPELKKQPAQLKHIIVFTDGLSDDAPMLAATQRAAAAGITVSVVATGDETSPALTKVATIGRGRYYAETNIADVPQIITQEAILASRTYITEGIFPPVISANTPLTSTLTRSPALLGYVATTAKSAATTELKVGKDRDPLLARWRAGLGTVVSWTSDAKARWSQRWVGWEGFRDFWTRTVRSTFPSGGAAGWALDARVEQDRLEIEVRAPRPLGPAATVAARVVDPTLAATDAALERVGAGSFRGSIPGRAEGSYLVVATVREGGSVVYRGTTVVTASYSAEYVQAGPDPTLLEDVARATGGRSSVEARQAFDPAGLRAARTHREVWPLLALLCALLLPVDIALRRVVVTGEDLRRARAALRTRRTRAAEPVERDEHIDQLLEAKRRTSARYR